MRYNTLPRIFLRFSQPFRFQFIDTFLDELGHSQVVIHRRQGTSFKFGRLLTFCLQLFTPAFAILHELLFDFLISGLIPDPVFGQVVFHEREIQLIAAQNRHFALRQGLLVEQIPVNSFPCLTKFLFRETGRTSGQDKQRGGRG